MFSLKPQKKVPFWKKLDFYKDNWSIIIFIPTILGGICQLLKLYSIDPSFIRFFAVEQVIPDGLFVSFIILTGFLCYLLFHNLYNFNFKLQFGWSIKNVLLSIKDRLALLFCLGVLLYYIYTSDPTFNKPTPLTILTIKLVIEILALFCLVEIIFIITVLLILKNSKDKKNPSNEEKETAINKLFNSHHTEIIIPLIILPLVIITSIYFIKQISTIYSRVYTLPPTKNEQIFLSKTKKTLNLSNDIRIEYYNGKYIFLKITDDGGKEKLLILKGESYINLIDKDDK
ncbi:hypothetical protein [Acinetobacter nosocomialis]|uniref:hypothetical protein n=1 Tax=Acinetobacter nosocomialis TaxID=106654 RepID=UPI001F21D902|nr:hypothetical protein [Acinetobacter nosocomialis]MCE5995914.1 hypothetical protein [Acinetobacter nosocomialis]